MNWIEWQITRWRTRPWPSRFPLKYQFQCFTSPAGSSGCIAMYRVTLTGTWRGPTTRTDSVPATRRTYGWDGDTAAGTEDFWLGLERVHLLTTSGNYRLRLEWQETVTDFWFSTEYWIFFIDDEAAFYELHVSEYVHGDDGRALWVRNFVIGHHGARNATRYTALPPACYFSQLTYLNNSLSEVLLLFK